MITFFSTPKPFRGHIGVIQRNALRSWKLVHPEAEVLLLGDDEGAAEVCRELGIRHIPLVEKNSRGTNYVASLFDQAQEVARHDLLCYLNCDILLLSDFRQVVEATAQNPIPFLMAGRRWDVDIRHSIDFQDPGWEPGIRKVALKANRQRAAQWIDYFVFRRGLFYRKIPSLVIGRAGWDNWVLWYARASGAQVIDASQVILAVHQNHDYTHHPEGEKGIYEGVEALENGNFLEGHKKFRTLDNATHVLTPGGLRRNFRHWLVQAKRVSYDSLSPAWFSFLDWTRPLRHRLGLRQKGGHSA